MPTDYIVDYYYGEDHYLVNGHVCTLLDLQCKRHLTLLI